MCQHPIVTSCLGCSTSDSSSCFWPGKAVGPCTCLGVTSFPAQHIVLVPQGKQYQLGILQIQPMIGPAGPQPKKQLWAAQVLIQDKIHFIALVSQGKQYQLGIFRANTQQIPARAAPLTTLWFRTADVYLIPGTASTGSGKKTAGNGAAIAQDPRGWRGGSRGLRL